MAMYTNPPLAGRPPYATDEPDSVYERPPQHAIRRIRETPASPNPRTSAYDVYDNYLERQSGVNAVGLGLLNMADDDDDENDEEPPKQRSHPAPKFPVPQPSESAAPVPPKMPEAPRTGLPAQVVGTYINHLPQAAVPEGRQPPPYVSQRTGPPLGLTVAVDPSISHSSPYGPKSPVPSTPHPLQAPMTPIIPAFARPPKAKTEVKFASSEPIMRGGSEDMLIPKRGEQGDDFWRRFSMVAKEENRKPYSQKQSSWLKKSQNGNNQLSRMVWIVGLIFVLCIAGAATLGWYLTHNKPSHQQPTAIGGSAGETQPSTPSSTVAPHAPGLSTVIQGVHPTNTVARREFTNANAIPTPFVGGRNHSKRTYRSH